ncbi:AAA family ATPase [Pelagibacteraceae bacterium]|nr:AAA family ATPase [Pelagibacteraceae bacterium]
MTENKYTTFINFLDNYSTNESIVTGEYEVLRRFIRNNYNNTNIKNVPRINCDYTPITNLTYTNPFFSMKPLQNREQIVPNMPDISLNDYTTIPEEFTEKTKEETIDIEINAIKDVIDLLNKYEYKDDTEYNIDLESLHKIKKELIMLDKMIGLSKLKQSILDQLLYFIQGLHKNNSGGDYKHTVIYGPPGTGKTEIAKIIGTMYSKMGILKKNIFNKVTRNDLIAGYLGQTAIKTKKIIDESLGGVLFIDEAYSLASREQNDSFSKECLDILCESLSDHKDDLMVIIAGYEDELNNTFFKANQGLKSRFIWRFSIDTYTPKELMQIFKQKVELTEWQFVDDNVLSEKWFHTNKEHLKSYGRDVEILLTYVKICHSRRIYGKHKDIRKKITKNDMDSGLALMLVNKETKDNLFISSLYV